MDFNDKNDLATKTMDVDFAANLDQQRGQPSDRPKVFGKKKFDITDHGGLLFIVIIVIVFLAIGFEKYIVKGNLFRTTTETKKSKEEAQEKSSGLDLVKTLEQAQNSIKEEIEAIRQEGGLPEQIFQRNIPPEKNVGALITKEFSAFPQKFYDELRGNISTAGPWFVDGEKLQKQAAVVLAEFKPQRDRLRELLDSPDAKFEQDLTSEQDLTRSIGLIPDDQNIDSSWAYLTMEECEIACCLQAGNMDGAVEALKYMLRFTELASQTQFPEMRIHVVYMRENILRILQALALDPKFLPKHANMIFLALHQTLKDWPSDANCWVGDRADSLKRFDLIRQNRISDALADDELELLRSLNVLGYEIPLEKRQQPKRESNLLDYVALYKPKSCDKDQDYYLKAMRVLIDSCSQPFYYRLRTLNQVADNLQTQQGKKDYPVLSMLFLSGIREQMQKQAMDKARVEAWYLALAASLKYEIKEGSVDPVRGKPYRMTRVQTPDGNRIIVFYDGNDGKAEVKE